MATVFGVQTIDLAAVYVFDTAYTCVYRHPEGKGKTVILIDKSGSMDNLQGVMRLTVSAIKCMAPESRGLWDVPAPGKCTALVDSFDAIVEKHAREVQAMGTDARLRVMVVTDGFDNASKCKDLRAEEAQGGDVVAVTRPFPPLPTTDDKDTFEAEYDEALFGGNAGWEDAWNAKMAEMVAARCSAVAEHIAVSGAELIVLGVGSEVKDFINACTKTQRYITTALLDSTASDAEVAAVVSTSVRTSRAQHARARERKQVAQRDDGEEAITAATARAVEPEELHTMAAETKRTTTAKERARARKEGRAQGARRLALCERRAAPLHEPPGHGLRGVARGRRPRAPGRGALVCAVRVRAPRTPRCRSRSSAGRLFPYPKNDEAHARRPRLRLQHARRGDQGHELDGRDLQAAPGADAQPGGPGPALSGLPQHGARAG